MNHERRVVRGSGLGRWLLITLLILLGIGLFFQFAPGTHPVAPPATPEVQ
jgi:hypothetical protein